MFTIAQIQSRGDSRRTLRFTLAVAVVSVAWLATQGPAHAGTSTGPSYGWPVQPFHQQHPVRAFFGDPRIAGTPKPGRGSFHFGVDVSAPDGTAVYATISGQIVVEPERPETVAIRADDRRTVFAYWHVVPSVRNGQRAVAYETVVGHIARGWSHVHFAESHDGRYLNPRRPGA